MSNFPRPAPRCQVCSKPKYGAPLQHKCHCRCGYDRCRNHAADLSEYVPLKYCSRCKARKYCSRRCQKKDWTRGEHRNHCNNQNV